MRLRDRLRVVCMATPWVTVPLAALGLFAIVWLPLDAAFGPDWYLYGLLVAVSVAVVALAIALRSRYRLTILDSSHLGVLYWLQRRL